MLGDCKCKTSGVAYEKRAQESTRKVYRGEKDNPKSLEECGNRCYFTRRTMEIRMPLGIQPLRSFERLYLRIFVQANSSKLKLGPLGEISFEK